MRKHIPVIILLILLLRHEVALLFNDNYWLAFHCITHICLMLFAWRIIYQVAFDKWDVVWLKIVLLFVSQDIIDRVFFDVYSYTYTDVIVVLTALWIIAKSLGIKRIN